MEENKVLRVTPRSLPVTDTEVLGEAQAWLVLCYREGLERRVGWLSDQKHLWFLLQLDSYKRTLRPKQHVKRRSQLNGAILNCKR